MEEKCRAVSSKLLSFRLTSVCGIACINGREGGDRSENTRIILWHHFDRKTCGTENNVYRGMVIVQVERALVRPFDSGPFQRLQISLHKVHFVTVGRLICKQ